MKCFAAALCLVLLIGLVPCVAAEDTVDGLNEPVYDILTYETNALIENILAYEAGTAGVEGKQALIDGRLAPRAGIDAEWFVIALSQYDNTLSFDAYADALESYLEKNEVVSASTRQKYALALLACNLENTAFVRDTLNESIGQMGIMSLVFGLHLLNNGLTTDAYTVSEPAHELAALQLDDGGFAVSGAVANADVTAMVIQSLAPHRTDEAIEATVERALVCLSAMQGADGSYQSYGVSNAESCAQVLMALCACGIDPYTDARFIKNGYTLVDVLMRDFKTDEGGYAHEKGGEPSVSATAQVLCAYVALWRTQNGQPFLYIFDGVSYDPALIPETPMPDADVADGGAACADYRLWVSLGIGAVTLIVCAVLIGVRRKRGLRDALLVLAVAAVLIVLTLTVRVQTPEDYYGESAATGARVGTVTLEIRCDSVAGAADHIPEDGTVLTATELPLYENDTVYDVLVRAAKDARLLLETNGVGSARYVSGIANLHEFDFGERSGWMYAVNGEYPSRGCGDYVPRDGDRVRFFYTTELGEEVGR